MTILVTGFDPFGGESINPAWEAVKRLPDVLLEQPVIKLEVPTIFGESGTVLQEAILTHQPDLVIAVGQAGGRNGITVERVAINLDDARIPDNAGNQPLDEVIQATGEAAYFSSLPIKAMVAAIRQVGLPASVSNSAGTFVCNHLMYQALFATNGTFARAGFIHVPFIPSQTVAKTAPSMNLTDIVKGLTTAIEAAIIHESDITAVEGTTH